MGLFADAGIQRIIDADGLNIALLGMLLVFVSLLLISVFIALLPRFLNAVADYLPDLEQHGAAQTPNIVGASQPNPHAGQVTPSEEIVAAIGFALHSRNSD